MLSHPERSDATPEADPRSRAARRFYAVATIVIVLAAVAAALARFHSAQDDAFISYRYAKRFAETGSLTFNGPGYERVEGYSNLTWTLLLALAYAAGIGPYLASKLFGILALVASILGGMRLTGELVGRQSAWRLFTGIAIGSSACFTFWSVQGLETTFVAALVVWALVFVVSAWREEDEGTRQRHAWIAGVALGVLGVSRPETALFGGVAIACLTLFLILDRRKSLGVVVRVGVGCGVLVLAQLAFRLLYYERMTANTVYAKVYGGGRLWRGRMYAEHFVQAHGLWVVAGIALLALCGIVVAVRRRRDWSLHAPIMAIAFSASYTAFIVTAGGDWMRGFRFFMHVFPLFAAVATWALACVATTKRLSDWRLRSAATLSVLAAVLYSNLVLAPNHPFGSQGAVNDGSTSSLSLTPPENAHWRVGLWLRDNLRPDGLVALSEAGIVPFVSDLPILDYLGLNDRRIADLLWRGSGDVAVADHVFRQRPSAIVMTGQLRPAGEFVGRLDIDKALQAHAEFAANYHLVKTEPFAAPTDAGTPVFAIFVRR